MTKQWSREQAANALPDMEVVESAADEGAADAKAAGADRSGPMTRSSAKAGRGSAPAPGPSMEDLRKKYLGVVGSSDEPPRKLRRSSVPDIAAANAPAVGGATPSDDDDEIDVLRVRRKRTAADADDDPGARTIITSKRHGPLGSQG